MGRIVIATYRAHAGREDRLRELLARHLPSLRDWGMVTGRAPLLLEAADGTLLEIFEWSSAEAIAQAHADPRVQALWQEFAACADFPPLASLEEASRLFPDFHPLA